MRLIGKWLRSPIQTEGKLVKRRKGVPQGSPLSPLLSNIMLHELDRELERQGLRFVRYSDDFSIYLKTKATARKVGNNIYRFLKKKLKLPINREKSGDTFLCWKSTIKPDRPKWMAITLYNYR